MNLKVILPFFGFIVLISGCVGSRPSKPEFVYVPQELLTIDKPYSLQTRVRLPLDSSPALSLASIAAVGDLMMGSWVINTVKSRGVDFPFDSTRTLIQDAGFAIANLEAPLSLTGKRFVDKEFTFKVPPYFAEGIYNAGFDVVTVANNHTMDFGCDGLMNTLDIMSEYGIKVCGGGINRKEACKPVYVTRNGVTIGFLGYSFTYPTEFWASKNSCGTCNPSELTLEDGIRKARENADLVVVSFHWGAEKRETPKDYQIYFAHRSIDFGADLVLGHHPHVLQGVEIYRNKLIAYSLGNYVFGSFSTTAKTSAVLVANISPDGLIYAKIVPINVYNADVEFQPRLLKDKAHDKVIGYLNQISLHLNKNQNIIDKQGNIFPYKIGFISSD